MSVVLVVLGVVIGIAVVGGLIAVMVHSTRPPATRPPAAPADPTRPSSRSVVRGDREQTMTVLLAAWESLGESLERVGHVDGNGPRPVVFTMTGGAPGAPHRIRWDDSPGFHDPPRLYLEAEGGHPDTDYSNSTWYYTLGWQYSVGWRGPMATQRLRLTVGSDGRAELTGGRWGYRHRTEPATSDGLRRLLETLESRP